MLHVCTSVDELKELDERLELISFEISNVDTLKVEVAQALAQLTGARLVNSLYSFALVISATASRDNLATTVSHQSIIILIIMHTVDQHKLRSIVTFTCIDTTGTSVQEFQGMTLAESRNSMILQMHSMGLSLSSMDGKLVQELLLLVSSCRVYHSATIETLQIPCVYVSCQAVPSLTTSP
jgi:hypothetical protein